MNEKKRGSDERPVENVAISVLDSKERHFFWLSNLNVT